MKTPVSEIPYGYCQCGCGGRTTVATRDRLDRGQRKGEPAQCIRWHASRVRPRVRRPANSDYSVEDRGFASACWIWQGTLAGGTGYGQVGVNGKSIGAHRWYYELHVGPIPEGLHLDHLCRNPACVNPAHLEAVTCAENIRRGAATRLSPEAVEEIRRSDLNTFSAAELLAGEVECLSRRWWTISEPAKTLFDEVPTRV